MLATHGTVGRSASGGEGFCTDEGRRTTSRLRQARGVVVGGVDISGAEFRAQAGDDAVARVAGVLTEALLTDPYTVSFLPRSRRRERLADMFDRIIRDTLRPDPARGGRALVKRRQRDARQAGVGVYLESSTRANVPLDVRLEFRETGPVTAYGTEDLTGMWWVA